MRLEVIVWSCLALGLIAIEVMAPGAFMLWLGIAAAAVLVLVLLFPDMPLLWQAVAFVAFSMALIPAYRHFFRKQDAVTDQPLLNRRTEQFIGQLVILHTAIVDGRGSIRVGDALWSVNGPDLPAGTRVRVVDADSMTLRVVPEP